MFFIPDDCLTSEFQLVENPEGPGLKIFMNSFIDVDGNGNFFKGEMIISKNRMKPTGLGIMKFENGSLYEG